MRNVTIEYRDDGFVVVLDGQTVSAPLVEFGSVKVIADAFPLLEAANAAIQSPGIKG